MADKPEQPTIYQIADWKPCVLLWSTKWPDPETGNRGCAYYTTNGTSNTEHVIKDTDGNKFKMYRVFFNDTAGASPPKLQVPGGKAVLQVFPKRAYMNINKSYKGLPFMYTDKYDSLVADGSMIEVTSVPVGVQPD